MTTDEPTILTQKDVDEHPNIEKKLADKIYQIIECCTCQRKDYIFHFIDGIQCQECFYKRIPMFGSSPVSKAYWKIDDRN